MENYRRSEPTNKYNVIIPKHVNKNDFLLIANLEIGILCKLAYCLMIETGEQLEYELPYALRPGAEDPVMEAMRDAYTSMEYYENALAGKYN